MQDRFREARHTLLSLDKSHRLARVRPVRAGLPAYMLPAPIDWVRALGGVDIEPHPLRPEIVGTFVAGPDLDGPRLVITATPLPWEVDPLEWTWWTWALAGRQVVMARWLGESRSDRFEIGAVDLRRGRAEIRRAVGLVDDGVLFRVEAAAPEERWNELHDVLWPCGVLFELERPTWNRAIERMTSYSGSGVAFDLPASWSVTRAWSLPDASGWMAWISGASPREAALRIDVVRPRHGRLVAAKVRRRLLRADLGRRGMTLSRKTEPLDVGHVLATMHGFGGMFVTEAREGGSCYEVRITHRDFPGVTIDYAMLAPQDQAGGVAWLRSCRALEMAMLSTRLD